MTPSGPVRIGVIGCGVIAYWAHLRVLRRLPGARLAAAADPDPGARTRAAALTRVPVHERAEELLERSDVDAVVIAAPTHLHAELALAACRAGKPFYLEKPIATTLEDARRVESAAARAKVRGVMGFNRRCHPLFRWARAVLTAERIGQVLAVQAAFCEPPPTGELAEWKRRRATGGGALLDLASHHVDLLRWLLDDEPTEVDARVESERSEDDTAQLRLAMRGGAVVQGLFSFRVARADHLEVFGERGVLCVDRHRTRLALRIARRWGYGVRTAWVAPTAGIVAWRVRRLARPSYDPSYRGALTRFVRLLRGGPAELATLADGVRSLEVVLAAEESARIGRPVAVPDPACASS